MINLTWKNKNITTHPIWFKWGWSNICMDFWRLRQPTKYPMSLFRYKRKYTQPTEHTTFVTIILRSKLSQLILFYISPCLPGLTDYGSIKLCTLIDYQLAYLTSQVLLFLFFFITTLDQWTVSLSSGNLAFYNEKTSN